MSVKLKTLFFIPLFAISLHPENLEEEILQYLLEEKYYQDKIQLGEKLALIQTQKSSELLKNLLKNPYHWNREAAVAGILAKKNPEFNTLLINQYLKDPILRNRIRKGLILNIEFYFNDLTKVYEAEENPNFKNLLLSLIAISPKSEDYLIKRVQSNLKVRNKKNPKGKNQE